MNKWPQCFPHEQVIVIDENRYAVSHKNGQYTFYYYQDEFTAEVLHREDGAASMFGDDSKKYWWMGNKVECSSDEEWKELVKYKMFW